MISCRHVRNEILKSTRKIMNVLQVVENEKEEVGVKWKYVLIEVRKVVNIEKSVELKN